MNDQVFSVGDKVMRVSNIGLGMYRDGTTDAPFGQVFCVGSLRTDERGNWIRFVGSIWWRVAKNFRRVEEIKLCVRAAEKMREPVTREASKPA